MSIVSTTNFSESKARVLDRNFCELPATKVLYNRDLIVEILSFAKADELQTCRRIMRLYQELTEPQAQGFLQVKARFSGQIRGPEFWKTRVGVHVENKPLPPDIFAILASPCPFWLGKMVAQTHVLSLVPQTVDGEPLTMKTLGELVKKPLRGNATRYRYLSLGDYTDPEAPPPHWVLMTRDVLPDTGGMTISMQHEFVTDTIPYEVPHVLDASVAIFMEYVAAGVYLFPNSPLTHTRCQEKWLDLYYLIVGGFDPRGLTVEDDIIFDSCGVAAERTFF